MAAGVDFSAHSGAKIASKPRIAVEGCGPGRDGVAAAGGRATWVLKVTAERHPDAENISVDDASRLPQRHEAGAQQGAPQRRVGRRR